jgi:LmbE family N-acetylglucosaminyl deacetylase
LKALELEGAGNPLSLLCLGAHADDLEIGCAGTLERLLEAHPGSSVRWVVLSAEGPREAEARASATCLLARTGSAEVRLEAFRESYFPFVGAQIKDYFEGLKGDFAPDLVLTHARDDLHQDHRLVSELSWNTFRDHLILEYEIPKYDGDLGRPNLFVPLTEESARRKVEHLLTCFESQKRRAWFREDTFWSLLRLRGMECNAPSGFAEAFVSRKAVL